MARRLREGELASVLHGWPDELIDLALELRRLVLGVAPQLEESSALHLLCYTVPGRP